MGFRKNPPVLQCAMAIYSLNHKSIGRTTHRAGRAGAHIRYISRRTAEPVIMSNLMPKQWQQAKRWLDQQERKGRKNARVADVVMVALPRELTRQQRRELVQDYLHSVTGNAVPWYVAIHQTGEDEHNPHAHIVIRDSSPVDGRRVLQMSERGSTKRIRAKWAERASIALKQAGHDVTIDHRSHRARGLEDKPTRHRGWRETKAPQRAKRPFYKRKKGIELSL